MSADMTNAQWIMRSNVAFSDDGLSPSSDGTARVMVDTMLVGDPVAPTSKILDLHGLSWSPASWSTAASSAVISCNTLGYVTVDKDATLYLRDLVLWNLQAAVQTGADGSILSSSQALPLLASGEDPSDYQNALSSLVNDMGNYTSLLWLFNYDRRVYTIMSW